VARKGGEQGLERHLPRKRLEYIKNKVQKRAVFALALACLTPPPFPFTPFILGAAALQYPRKKLLLVVGAFRMVRFTVEGLLAIRFGRHILKLADKPALRWAILGLVVIAIGGSIFSIIGWIRRSRGRERQPSPAET
jgi:membrane protein DedA with SNARE-associated domain